ncbi:ZIP5 [Scenedesmus sp. PABB004]|nr:ZIP5 [Scenedesmus sp. PABB004]
MHLQAAATMQLDGAAALRGLLHGAGAPAYGDAHAPETTQSYVLRLIALAAILAGGGCGVAAPQCGRWAASDGPAARVVRCFAGGTILALALVHIIPEGLEQLEAVSPAFPAGGLVVAAGVLAMVFLDWAATYALVGRQLAAAAAAAAAAPAKGAAPRPSAPPAGGVHVPAPCCPAPADVEAPPAAAPGGGGASSAPTGVSALAHSHHHAPGCEITSVRRWLAAYTLEAGCVFHSVIIGVSIGVTSEAAHGARQLLATTTAVMVFHQALEGLALGAALAASRLGRAKRGAMALGYALCMPAGVAIGIAAAPRYNADSLAALAAQGALNAASGGMLLAVCMFHLIGEEFSKSDLLLRPRLAAGLVAATLCGVGGMAVIGIWG